MEAAESEGWVSEWWSFSRKGWRNKAQFRASERIWSAWLIKLARVLGDVLFWLLQYRACEDGEIPVSSFWEFCVLINVWLLIEETHGGEGIYLSATSDTWLSLNAEMENRSTLHAGKIQIVRCSLYLKRLADISIVFYRIKRYIVAVTLTRCR